MIIERSDLKKYIAQNVMLNVNMDLFYLAAKIFLASCLMLLLKGLWILEMTVHVEYEIGGGFG